MRTILSFICVLLCQFASAQTPGLNNAAYLGSRAAAASEPPGIFVDSVSGSDSNLGTSNSPWASSQKVNATIGFSAATNIYFKRGGKYGKFYAPTNSVVTDYGTANYAPNIYGGITNSKPVFSGAITLTNSDFTLTSGKTNTYQIDLTGRIPIATNLLAGVTTSNVLMVWQNNNMLVGWTVSGSPSYAYNTNTVDAGLGRFYFDVTTKILYVSPTNVSSIITNGGFFEASIDTQAFVGMANYSVSNIIAEKAYAYDSSGRQGYQIYAGSGGFHYRCVGRYGWNHLIGLAEGVNFAPVTFDSCYALGMKTDASGGSTAYIIYSAGSTPSLGIITNCLAAEPTPDTVNDSYGFYAHDNGSVTSVVCQVVNSVAWNMDNGFATGASGRNTNWYGNTAVNCKTGYLIGGGIVPVRNFTSYWATVSAGTAVQFVGSARAPIYDSKFIFTNDSKGIFTTTTDAVAVTNCIFAATGTRAGWGMQVNSTTAIHSWSNSFYNVTYGYVNGTMTSGNYNNYSTLFRIGEDMTASPGFWSQANFATWQSAWSPVDANSTTTNPGYDSGFYNYTVVDPTGGDAN